MDPGQSAACYGKKDEHEEIQGVSGDGIRRFDWFPMSTIPNITIYGSATCSFCMAARMLLKRRGLDYDDVLMIRN